MSSREPIAKPLGITLCAALCLVLFPNVHAGETRVSTKRSWKRVAEFLPDERTQFDFRSDTPRDPKIPYIPAEPYPFTPPFTVEEIAYRMMNFSHNARWPHTLAESWGTITKAGYLTSNVNVLRFSPTTNMAGVPGQIQTAPGDVFMRFAFYYTYPPRREHMQGLWVHRRTDKKQRTKIDSFLYMPDMRRVRRLPQPLRDVPITDMVPTFDDLIGRDAWEFSWHLIGSDVLLETVRFPTTRPIITLAHPDGRFYDVSTSDLRMMGDTYPFYTQDGGVPCLVLVAEPRKDWLPNYAASKLIYWIDRHYFFPLRIEQYDTRGELRTVQVRLAKQENPAWGNEGYASLLTVYWDCRLDMTSYTLRDAHRVIDWTEEEAVVMFSPEFMRRSWLKYAQRTQSMVTSPKEFYLRPALELGKFPEERHVRLSLEVEERIRAQDAAGHLLFEVAVESDASGSAAE
jgi:hypothetical protein